MTDQVAEVKQKSDIISVISEYVELKKAGRNFKALCPFHSEKTPSFIVSPELQIFKCFGCGESGDVISFMQKYEGLEFYEALKILADKSGVKLSTFKPGFKDEKEKILEVNSYAARFYAWVLLNHRVGKHALDYLTVKRGIKLETIKTFHLGYAPESSRPLADFLITKKKIYPNDLEKAGLCIVHGREVIDRFRGRVIFPLFDHRDKVVGFAGRLLPQDEKKELAKYINTPETPVYHKSSVLYGLNLTKQEIKKQKAAVIVEGELDLISSWQAGFKNTVAIKGSSLTDEQLRLLSRFTSKLVLALDADIAGDDAARRGIHAAENLGFEVKVVELKGYKDPDEAARNDPDKLRTAIENAKVVWDFLIDSALKRYKDKSGNDLAKISRDLVPVLTGINDKIVQAHYIAVLAQKLGVTAEVVAQEVERTTVNKTTKTFQPESIKLPEKSRNELLEERLLTIAFRYDPKYLTKAKILDRLTTPLAKRIYEEYKAFRGKHKEFDPSQFASELSKELLDGFTDMLLKDIRGLNQDGYKTEFELINNELEILRIKNGLNDLAAKIKVLEAEKSKESLKKLEVEFGELTRKLNELEEKNFRGIIL